MTFAQKAVKQSTNSMAIVEIEDIQTEYDDLFQFVEAVKSFSPFEARVQSIGEDLVKSDRKLLIPRATNQITEPDRQDDRIYVVDGKSNLKHYLRAFIVRP